MAIGLLVALLPGFCAASGGASACAGSGSCHLDDDTAMLQLKGGRDEPLESEEEGLCAKSPNPDYGVFQDPCCENSEGPGCEGKLPAGCAAGGLPQRCRYCFPPGSALNDGSLPVCPRSDESAGGPLPTGGRICSQDCSAPQCYVPDALRVERPRGLRCTYYCSGPPDGWSTRTCRAKSVGKVVFRNVTIEEVDCTPCASADEETSVSGGPLPEEEEEEGACSSECHSPTCVTDFYAGHEFLVNGTCFHFCSPKDGWGFSRFCGTGPNYEKEGSIDCRRCA